MRYQDIPKFPFASYRVNMSWAYLESWIEQQERSIHLLELDPEYQRGYVWNDFQKTAYIEYRLRGGFSGRDLFWNCPNWMSGRMPDGAKLEIVDGKQRLSTVREFLAGKVKAFGLYYNEWDEPLRGIEPDFIFHINNLTSRKMLLEWYISMNTGGSIHTEEDLAPAFKLLEDE